MNALHPLVYVAGGSSERLTVCRPMIDRLLAAGVSIAYDWTRDPGWDAANLGPTDLAVCAARDIGAIRECDLFWYMTPAEKSEGSATELGAALAMRKRVIVSGPHTLRLGRIFPMLGARYEDHETVYALITAGAA